MLDAYQQAVEYLTENPHEIENAWYGPSRNEGGCLFKMVKSDSFYTGFDGGDCGCLTMIRNAYCGYLKWHNYQAPRRDLNDAIVADTRIPLDSSKITVDHLPIFAGWQRRIDILLNRTPPALDPRLPAPKGDIEIPAVEYSLVGGSISAAAAEAELAEAVKQHSC